MADSMRVLKVTMLFLIVFHLNFAILCMRANEVAFASILCKSRGPKLSTSELSFDNLSTTGYYLIISFIGL